MHLISRFCYVSTLVQPKAALGSKATSRSASTSASGAATLKSNTGARIASHSCFTTSLDTSAENMGQVNLRSAHLYFPRKGSSGYQSFTLQQHLSFIGNWQRSSLRGINPTWKNLSQLLGSKSLARAVHNILPFHFLRWLCKLKVTKVAL